MAVGGDISCVKHVRCAYLMILVFSFEGFPGSLCSQLDELICLKPRGTDIVAVQRSVIRIMNW